MAGQDQGQAQPGSSRSSKAFAVGDRVFVRRATAFTLEGAPGVIVSIEPKADRPLRVQLDPPVESPFDLMDLRNEDVVPDLMAALEASLSDAPTIRPWRDR